jgi:hypothetical protein
MSQVAAFCDFLQARLGSKLLWRAICHASLSANADEAIRRIDIIWRGVDKVTFLAESRMRILLARIRGPQLALEPEWLLNAIDDLNVDITGAPGRSAVGSGASLVRALLAVRPDQRADLEPYVGGAVIVKWRGSSLRWLVGPPRLPWPGVSVQLYVRPDPSLPKLDAQSCHYAPVVVEHALKNLESLRGTNR